MRTLQYLLRGTGRRRAADYIAVVEAERDQALAKLVALHERHGHANSLLIEVCCANDKLTRANARQDADINLLVDAYGRLEAANGHLADENDELAHRLIEARAEIQNLKAISCPAPADCGPAIPLPCDPNADTTELTVSTLWDAHGLRTVAA